MDFLYVVAPALLVLAGILIAWLSTRRVAVAAKQELSRLAEDHTERCRFSRWWLLAAVGPGREAVGGTPLRSTGTAIPRRARATW